MVNDARNGLARRACNPIPGRGSSRAGGPGARNVSRSYQHQRQCAIRVGLRSHNTTERVNTLEQQLSSGLAISSPADNPAGYIAAQGFTSQIGGTKQAISNANQAISLVQTADGAITQQINILQQILSIANQAANGINSTQQLQSLQQVVSQLQTQVSTICAAIGVQRA